MYIFKLKPSGKDYLWGGNKLKQEYNKDIDIDPLAETWEFSFHKNGPSYIENGEFSGKSLLEVFQMHPEFFGPKFLKEKEVPVLVKFIDAKQKLSIQVHPDDCYAQKYEGQNGKNEMWYVLEAKENAKLIYGFEHDVDEQMIRKSLEEGTIEKHLHFESIKSGDVFYIPAGTIHGIGEGVVLLEVQQSSDVTYRFYDYDRVDKNGNKRELHLEKALDVLNMKANNEVKARTKLICFNPNVSEEELINCKNFCVKKYTLKGLLDLDLSKDDFNIFVCTKGTGIIVNSNNCTYFKKGQTMVATNSNETIQISGDCEILKINC